MVHPFSVLLVESDARKVVKLLTHEDEDLTKVYNVVVEIKVLAHLTLISVTLWAHSLVHGHDAVDEGMSGQSG